MKRLVLAEFAEPLLHGWIAECVLDSSVEFQDHVARRILGRPESAKVRNVKSGQACFIHGRDVRRGRQTCW